MFENPHCRRNRRNVLQCIAITPRQAALDTGLDVLHLRKKHLERQIAECESRRAFALAGAIQLEGIVTAA